MENQARPLEMVGAAHAPLVGLVGCDNTPDVLACLRAVQASALVNNQGAVPIAAFALEPRVLPEDPFTVLQRDGSPVPLLIGSTREEATDLAVLPVFDLSLTAAQYTDTIDAIFDSGIYNVAKKVLALYPASAYDRPFWALVAAFSDSAVTCEVRDTARAAVGPPNEPQYAPVWRYLFTHRVENDPYLKNYRAFHTEELFFVFGHLEQLANPYAPTTDEVHLSQVVMDYWTRFAAKGNPNGPGAFHWPRYSEHDMILQLDVSPARLQGYHNPQCDFWKPLGEIFCSENICNP